MAEQHHYSNQPLVSQIRKQDQESRQRVMKNVLIVVPFLSDEHMGEQSAEMFAELQQVKNFHSLGSLS